jgi:endonuclease/exonuclease/phosphatase family metal-dependent hydrolase
MGQISPCNPEPTTPGMAWYGPLDPKDRWFTEARCRTVGPPVLDPIPAARFGDLAPDDSLAVFSWNIDVGAGDLLLFLEQEVGLSCQGDRTTARIGSPNSVILVQEAFRRWDGLPPMNDARLAARRRVHDPHPGGDPDIVEAANSCGLGLVYVPSGRNGRDEPGEGRLDKGNAILSTLPLSDIIAVEQPFETERKVAVAATVQAPGVGLLRLVNVHLEVASEFHRTLFTGNQTRVRQAAGLLEALTVKQEEGEKVPTLLAGDFNTWSGGESALKMLRNAFPESPAWDGHTTRGPFPSDHIFFRAEGAGGIGLVQRSYRAIDDPYSSDHQALFVWVRVGGSLQAPPLTGEGR